MSKKNITLKFINLEEALKVDSFRRIDDNKILGVNYPMAFFEDDNQNELQVPVLYFGKTIEFGIDKEHNAYCPLLSNKHIPKDERDILEIELIHILKELCSVVKGEFEKLPINIDGDTLTFDEQLNIFRCGCKRISLKLADEIFQYMGKVLGYTIT